MSGTAGEKSLLVQLPRTGPRTFASPTLITITQLEEIQLHYQSPFTTTVPQCYNHIRASLRSPVDVSEEDAQNPPIYFKYNIGQSVCTRAAIGLLYDCKGIVC